MGMRGLLTMQHAFGGIKFEVETVTGSSSQSQEAFDHCLHHQMETDLLVK